MARGSDGGMEGSGKAVVKCASIEISAAFRPKKKEKRN